MYIDHQIAQKIVDRSMKIIGHNVNVMNHQAIIVGSGDPDRIDQLHEGALQVLNAKAEIDFDSDQAESLTGVQGGINIPITNDGQIIGVVGITGNPNEVRKYADLVVMTAELVLEQAMLAAQVRWDRRLQESVIVRLIEGGWQNDTLFNDRVERMKIDLNIPRVAMIVDLRSAETQKDISLSTMQGILRLLEKRDPDTLLAISSPTQIVILQKILLRNEHWDYQKSQEHQEKYRLQLAKQTDINFHISLGQYFEGIEGLAESYQSALKTLEVGKLSHLKQQLFSAREMLLDLVLKDSLESWSGPQLLADYEKLVKKDSNGSLQKTLQVYFANNTDFSLTAESLHVHRNTLRYRLEKINDILDIDLKNLQDLFRLYIATRLSEWDNKPE
ncbi:sugar diacid recognition domain-containing protein [Neptuniibacter sp. QD34_54]|uniref:sugar diacid recognition domain-containing protein n=1 Tax=Neptuniibacter sp. QD34_54 TaxID=3398208 RepID=UPI0039F58A0A